MKKTKPSKSAAKSAVKTPAKPAAKAAVKAGAKTPAKVAAKTPVKPAAKVAAKAPAKVAAKPVAKAVKPAAKSVAAKAPVAAKGTAKAPAVMKPVKGAAAKAAVPVGNKSAKGADKETSKEPVAAKAAAPAKEPKKAAKAAAPKVEARVEPRVIVPEEPDTAEDVVLTDAEGRRYCRTKDCDRLAEVDTYCRYHYILLWKNIQIRRNILQEGKLGRYIEELTARYPDKFLEILKKDLRSEKDFLAAIQELEIDESAVEAEFDDEESQADLFEIQRVSDSGNAGDRSDSDDRF